MLMVRTFKISHHISNIHLQLELIRIAKCEESRIYINFMHVNFLHSIHVTKQVFAILNATKMQLLSNETKMGYFCCNALYLCSNPKTLNHIKI